MPFHAGSATDYNDLLQLLRDFAVNEHVISAGISSGGTGYTVGDILTVAGGTVVNSLTATLEVTSVSGGVIDGIRVLNAGAYSSNPSTPNSPTGGTGSSASITLTFDSALWTLARDISYGVATGASVTNGGTGYTVSDTIQIDSIGSLVLSSPMTFNVDSVSTGVITAVSVVDGGEVIKDASGSFAVTGGTGASATLDPTITAPDDSDLQIWLTSTDGNSIQIGAKMYIDDDNFNWVLRGATGFSSGLDFFSQSGTSDGDCYVPLALTTINYWFFVNDTRIIMVAEVGGTYVNMYLGFLNRFGTETEYPYPLVVAGCCTASENAITDNNQINMSGLVDPIADNSGDAGPMRARDAQGWRTFRNSTISGSSRNSATTNCVYPCGRVSNGFLIDADNWYNTGVGWGEIIPNNGNPGTEQERMLPTPNGTDNTYPLIPATLVQNTPDPMILGELDSVFWVTRAESADLLNSEDVLEQNGEVFLVFQNVGRTQTFTYLAIRRD